MDRGAPNATSIEAIGALRLRQYDSVISSPILNTNHSTQSMESALMGELDTLRSLTVRFSQRLNRVRCPLLRLPPEIMQLIIYSLIDSIAKPRRRPKELILLGRVCHDFREIILGMHALWGRVAFASKALPAEILLERAHDAPISLRFDYFTPNSHDALGLQYIHRAREIDVQMTDIVLRPLIHTLQKHSLPLLCSLDLWANAPTFDLPSPWILSAPNLRNLSLSNVHISSDAHWPMNLTKLKLRYTSSSAMTFVDILKSCTRLRELELPGSIPQRNCPI